MKSYCFTAVVLCGLFGLFFYSPVSGQTDSDLPPRPIPPAEPASIEPVEPAPENERLPKNEGAKIVLHLPAEAYTWTLVQWQDAAGRWHNVDGWRGYPTWDEQNQKWVVEWWIARENFSEGPFRWIGTADETQQRRLFTTATFILPEQTGQIVYVAHSH